MPAKSRVVVRRPQRSIDVAAALRSSREALADIEGQLDALLAALRNPAAPLDARAPARLRGATRDAGTALATLGTALAGH